MTEVDRHRPGELPCAALVPPPREQRVHGRQRRQRPAALVPLALPALCGLDEQLADVARRLDPVHGPRPPGRRHLTGEEHGLEVLERRLGPEAVEIRVLAQQPVAPAHHARAGALRRRPLEMLDRPAGERVALVDDDAQRQGVRAGRVVVLVPAAERGYGRRVAATSAIDRRRARRPVGASGHPGRTDPAQAHADADAGEPDSCGPSGRRASRARPGAALRGPRARRWRGSPAAPGGPGARRRRARVCRAPARPERGQVGSGRREGARRRARAPVRAAGATARAGPCAARRARSSGIRRRSPAIAGRARRRRAARRAGSARSAGRAGVRLAPPGTIATARAYAGALLSSIAW